MHNCGISHFYVETRVICCATFSHGSVFGQRDFGQMFKSSFEWYPFKTMNQPQEVLYSNDYALVMRTVLVSAKLATFYYEMTHQIENCLNLSEEDLAFHHVASYLADPITSIHPFNFMNVAT